MSFETWVQIGVGIVLTIIAPLLGELFWKSLFMTVAGFCFGVALWQVIESHDWHRGYFVAGCALLAILVSSFILWSAPKIETVNNKIVPQPTVPAPIATQSEPAPTIHEKVEPMPSVKPIPPQAAPPAIKKDIPTKPKEIIPDKPEEPIPIKPKETLASVLIKKYTVLPPAIVGAPDRFIPIWMQRINRVRIDREKRGLRPDLQAVIRQIGRPPSQGLTVKEFVDDAVAEATFTLHCLASEGYIQITETAAPGRWYAVDFPNLEFEFVPERLSEFIEGL